MRRAHIPAPAVGPGARTGDGPVIRLAGVTKTYRPRYAAPTVALRGVSLEVAAGEAVAVMGPSGSGKSTLLAIVGTLEPADGGDVAVLGYDVRRVRPTAAADFRFRCLGFVFQQYYLLPGLTVYENMLARYIGRRLPAGIHGKAAHLLDRVGLGGKRDALPRELSGGEQQRACIARALLSDPPLILADEPTGNLDSENGRAVVDLMLEMVRERGATLLLVTHNETVARRMDRVVEMRDGLVVA